MSWDFETDPDFQAKLDWADAFVTREGRAARLCSGRLWQFTPLEGGRKRDRSTR